MRVFGARCCVYIANGGKTVKIVEKREVKLKLKGVKDTLQRKINLRRAKLSQLTAKKNEMRPLMDDDGNLEVVKIKLAVAFNHIFGEFCVSVKRAATANCVRKGHGQ